MLLYWVGDRYVRTQGEAQKLGFGAATDVPTDKDGLMAFLNERERRHAAEVNNAVTLPQIEANADSGFIAVAPSGDVHLVEPDGEAIRTTVLQADDPRAAQLVADAKAYSKELTLRECDIEDHIHNADPVRLAVLATAVCWRIKELTK